MAISLHNRSVNVSRVALLEKLKENLELHRKEYAEALLEYRQRLLDDLKLAHKKVSKVDDVMDLQNFSFTLPFPQNHEQDYVDVIEMLEMSVDETINLDSQAFKAYIKNEWQWQGQFRMAKMAYAAAGSALSL